MKKFGIILAAAVALAACQQPTPQPMQFDQRSAVEQEDCDADDLLEGDEDCYGIDLDKKKKKKVVGYDRYGKPVYKTVKPAKKGVFGTRSKPSTATRSSWGSSSRSSSSFRSSSRRR